jgi:hypothetical protein
LIVVHSEEYMNEFYSYIEWPNSSGEYSGATLEYQFWTCSY